MSKEPLYPHIPKSLYINLYRQGRLVHTATIRSDWRESDYKKLAEDFPDTYIKTARETIPVSYLGQAYHNTDFKSLAHKQYSN
jgi:hypothetical protein